MTVMADSASADKAIKRLLLLGEEIKDCHPLWFLLLPH
jgi:hypothetical protein